MTKKLNKISERITQPRAQGASQAMLHATGMTKSDLNKAQVGIASMWYEGNPCNMHLLSLGEKVKQGDIVGTLGKSGRATGPHLDIRLNWFEVKLDPASVLKLK